jgi:ABC-type branched-subunit amino acid transport system substrate-binding protein
MANRRRLWCGPALAAAVVLAMAGCGSSSGSAASGGNTGSKSPVKVLMIAVLSNPAFSNPQSAVAAKAYVKQANAHGGINGHPIQLQVCDSNLDPNKETACFQQAVTNKVAAVVGSFLLFGTGMKLLERAGIPFIGGNGTTPAEFQSPVSFPADAGEVGWYYGEAALMKHADVTKPAIMYCDTAACGLSVKLAQAYWAQQGGSKIKTVSSPMAQAQYTSQAASAVAGGTNGVMLAAPTQSIPKLVTAVRQANFKGPMALIDPFVTTDTLKAMGSMANGLLVAGLLDPVTDTKSPGVTAFVKAMNSEDPSASEDGIAEHAWNGFDLFGQVAKTVKGDVTGPSLLKALQNVTSPITLGLSGPWLSPGHGAAPLAGYPRLTKYTLSYVPEKIESGRLVTTAARVGLAS